MKTSLCLNRIWTIPPFLIVQFIKLASTVQAINCPNKLYVRKNIIVLACLDLWRHLKSKREGDKKNTLISPNGTILGPIQSIQPVPLSMFCWPLSSVEFHLGNKLLLSPQDGEAGTSLQYTGWQPVNKYITLKQWIHCKCVYVSVKIWIVYLAFSSVDASPSSTVIL